MFESIRSPERPTSESRSPSRLDLEFWVRAATPQDLNAVVEMRLALLESERGYPANDYERLVIISQVAAGINDPGTVILIAGANGDPGGMVWCNRETLAGHRFDSTIRMEGVFVWPPFRRTKVLKLLIDTVESVAGKAKLAALQGTVLLHNEAVKRMWEKRGAKVIGWIVEKRYDE